METDGDNGDRLGNTGSSRSTQYVYWCFTLNNYEVETMETMETVFRSHFDWYIFQEETGDEGTPHLQGTVKCTKKMRLTELKRIDAGIHWEPTKAIKASILYCTKRASRTGRVYSYNVKIPKENEEIEVDEPYGWQLEAMKILQDKPDRRTIHWFWEPDGNVGKTCLCKYLCMTKDALMLSGKAGDMYHMISKFPDKREVILVDVPRSAHERFNYGAIEQIKNGLIFSGKYEGCQLVFNCPHVLVFANEPPDVAAMSMDRWCIHDIRTAYRPLASQV